MPEELLKKLEEVMFREGPFMDYGADIEIVPELLAWIGGDWQRLRTLLNYAHECGEQVAFNLQKRDVDEHLERVKYRQKITWSYRLRHPDWYKEQA